jgi:ribosomal protein S6--L-glutamate ligase
LIAGRPTGTNNALCRALIQGAAWEEFTPHEALEVLRPGDGALGRLDVLPTLDGVDDGLWALGALAARGVHVLNDPPSLLTTHDKLLTARILRRHAIAHPATVHIRDGRVPPAFKTPVVVKPRFGSWGRGVYRCDDAATFSETLARISEESWFQRHGALVQELVPPQGYDLRILVAAGRIVGAVHRIAAPGEWRTNVNLGAVRRPVDDPPREAVALAVEAALATGTALVGVDLLPTVDRGWVVIELNGAVEFTPEYSDWFDVFAETALLLAGEVLERRTRPRPRTFPTAVTADDGLLG